MSRRFAIRRAKPKPARVGRATEGRVSNNESFIDEVNEEVQRDKLFQLLRKYGWIGVVVVLVLVGGTAFNEWRKAQDRAAAEGLGDAFLAAVEADDAAERAAALAGIPAEGNAAVLRDLLAASELTATGDQAAAAERLRAIAATPGIDPIYADLAVLKAAMQGQDAPAERIAILEPLSQPGAPFRLLALEQIAYAQVEAGEAEAAQDTALSIIEDADVGRALRERAQNLIVALGGAVPSQSAETGAADTGTAQQGNE